MAPLADGVGSHDQPTRTAKERLGVKASDEQRVDNCKVPPDLNEACVVQAFAERGHNTCTQLRHTRIHKSNHRHRGVLRAPCERPRCCRAAEQILDENGLFQLYGFEVSG